MPTLMDSISTRARLDVELLRSSQFPDSYLTPAGGNIQRPISWVKPHYGNDKGPTFRLSPKLEDETSSGVGKD
jgi:hypothetical protein